MHPMTAPELPGEQFWAMVLTEAVTATLPMMTLEVADDSFATIEDAVTEYGFKM